jgi:pyroglutamyl-peptidase
VTGFSVFPGAPLNPTEELVARLRTKPPVLADMADFRAETLAVEYGTVARRLSEIGEAFAPDIALHFGLAAGCRGFRLERQAHNSHRRARPDNLGLMPDGQTIFPGPEFLQSTLPLEQIADALTAAGLPVEWSQDAGGYLCDMVFALSCGHACAGFRPTMSGFIHIPAIQELGPLGTMDEVVRGAGIIIETSCALWKPQ